MSMMLGLVESIGFQHHVNLPTHEKGQTLDLVRTRDRNLEVLDLFFLISLCPLITMP